MMTRGKTAFAGALVGLGLLAATAIPAFAQQTPPAMPGGQQPGTPPMTHEQMDQMMDAMGGAGTAQRMHEQMGGGDAQQGEQLMEQCVQMMSMMQQMQGMMGAGGMQGMGGMNMPGMGGMMDGGGMPGMRGGAGE